MDNKYNKSKIYKIIADTTDDIYIGSTVEPLSSRMSKHRCLAKKYSNGTHKNRCTSYDIINNHPTAKIILLEEFPCETKEQLRAREQYHIDQHKEGGKLVNKLDAYVPIEVGRKKKRQYLSENSEYFKELRKQRYVEDPTKEREQQKIYRENNRDKIKIIDKEYREANKEKLKEKARKYIQEHAEERREYQKQYYEKTKANRMEKYVCECGVELSRSSKSRHEKRRDHLEWLAKNDIPTII